MYEVNKTKNIVIKIVEEETKKVYTAELAMHYFDSSYIDVAEVDYDCDIYDKGKKVCDDEAYRICEKVEEKLTSSGMWGLEDGATIKIAALSDERGE